MRLGMLPFLFQRLMIKDWCIYWFSFCCFRVNLLLSLDSHHLFLLWQMDWKSYTHIWQVSCSGRRVVQAVESSMHLMKHLTFTWHFLPLITQKQEEEVDMGGSFRVIKRFLLKNFWPSQTSRREMTQDHLIFIMSQATLTIISWFPMSFEKQAQAVIYPTVHPVSPVSFLIP